MSKSATVTSTKKATKRANAKPSDKQGKADKTKRAPSAYNLFVQAKMKEWRENNPGAPVKDAMSEIGAMWKDAPENPNRGKEPKSRKPKNKVAKATKEPPSKSSEAEQSGEESGWYHLSLRLD